MVIASTDSTLCRDLCRYRDVELYRQYDATFKSYQVSSAEKAELMRMRNGLLSDPQWSTSNARLATAELLMIVKMTCDLMSAAIKLTPGTTLATRAVSSTRLMAANVAEMAVRGVEMVQTTVEQGVEASAYKQIVAEMNPVLAAIKALDDFRSGIDKMQQLGMDRDELRSEVTRILDLVEANIAKHDRILSNNSMRVQDLNEAVRGIDDFLLRNDCARYCTNAQEHVKAREDGLPAPVPTAPAAVEEALGPGQFYVFLSYRSGDATIYSRPAKASGFEDPLIKAKEAFATEAQTQFGYLLPDLRQKMSADNFQKVQVNYSAPYSRTLLQTPKAAMDAAKAAEGEVRSAVAGLPGANKLVFLHLK